MAKSSGRKNNLTFLHGGQDNENAFNWEIQQQQVLSYFFYFLGDNEELELSFRLLQLSCFFLLIRCWYASPSHQLRV